jgi:ATP-dependent helicase STH1/SNF2
METQHRVLIFFQMTRVMTIFEDFLMYRGLKYFRLDGQTKQEDRSKHVATFNDPNAENEINIFLLSTRAGGLGINLQSADTVIIYDSDWNPHADLQAMDRAHRIGQTKEVRIFRLITERSVEEIILERARRKLDMDGKVIQAGKFDQRTTEKECEDLLLQYLKGSATDDTGLESDLTDEDLNDLIARDDYEREVFHRMDQERLAKDRGRPRLIEESELPGIFLEDGEEDDEVKLIKAHGERERKVIFYGELLTDTQFENAVEKDLDLEELSEKRLRRRVLMKEKRRKQELLDQETPDSGKKRKVKRKIEDEDEDEDGNKRLHTEDGMHFSALAYLVLEAVENVHRDDRILCEAFVHPISKEEYPEYYHVIEHPICMHDIRTKLDNHHYPSLDAYHKDWKLLFANALAFNQEGSEIYEDAKQLEGVMEQAFKRHFEQESFDTYVDTNVVTRHSDTEEDDDEENTFQQTLTGNYSDDDDDDDDDEESE